MNPNKKRRLVAFRKQRAEQKEAEAAEAAKITVQTVSETKKIEKLQPEPENKSKAETTKEKTETSSDLKEFLNQSKDLNALNAERMRLAREKKLKKEQEVQNNTEKPKE